MPHPVSRYDVRTLIDADEGQLVEVLPRREFDDEHLPNAMNLPLKRLDARGARALDRARPVIVYCWDAL